MNHFYATMEYVCADQSPSSPASTRPPRWFRLAIMMAATLILCSCTAAPTAQEQIQTQARPGQLDGFPSGGVARPVGSRWSRTPPVLPAGISAGPLPGPPPRLPPAANVTQATWHGPVAREASAPCCNTHATTLDQACGCGPEVGPRDEYLCDGGDDGLPVGIRQDWTVDGLEQEDTIAHYDTVDGRTVVTPSNRVCIYAPRFGVVRRVTNLNLYERYDRADGFDQNQAPVRIDEQEKAVRSLALLEPSIHRDRQPSSLLRERQQAGQFDRQRRVAEFDGSLAPYANLQIIRAGTMSGKEQALVARSSLAAISWAADQGPQVLLDSKQALATVSEKQVGVIYRLNEPNKPRLRLLKLASSGYAQPGEVVEFTLRYDNIGNREIGNVTIVDNLTTRLEYVPESAKSSLPASFSTEPNDHGSVILRWEIRDPLEAGKGGILQFKCKVR